MKQVNFTHPGGFPLEQETLERLQTAYRHELFGALKSHLGINPENDYIVAPATNEKEGWAIIHQDGEGILYPIQPKTPTQFLKTTRTGTNLTYGAGESQTAYFDYEAKYISDTDYANRPTSPPNTDASAIHYYDLNNPAFIVIKDIQTIEGIIKTIEANIDTIKTNIAAIETNIDAVEADISNNYLPLKGSKAMEGDLNLGDYQLSKLDIKETPTANVRVTDFRLGSNLGRALVNDSTNLSLNYASDWENTNIGGKVYLNNISSSNSGSLLVVDSSNQVTKSNTLIESLIKRITDLEEKPATAVPKGMIAIWGKPAPFPEGWEEYVPLRGRVPVGIDTNDPEFNTLLGSGGSKEKKLTKENIPPLDLKIPVSSNDNSGGTFKYVNATDVDYATDKEYTGVVNKGNVTTAINILNPYRVVHFIEYTGNITPPADTTAPTSPINLTASKIGTKSLTLSWTASTDNVGVTNYLVYKDNSNTPLAELGKDVLTYNVTGLSANTSYSFQVRAKDAVGNLSVPATVTTATLAADSTPPTVPAYLHCYTQGQGLIGIEWGTSTDDNGPITYELWRTVDGFAYFIFQTTNNTYSSDSGLPNSTYSYKVRAIDSNGNMSAFSYAASITISSL